MKNDYTHISIVLDTSGSMDIVRDDTIGGLNSFIQSQKRLPSRCSLTLVKFNNHPETIYDAIPLAGVQPLTHANYTPNGSTALLDAVGAAIDRTGWFLLNLPESERPAKVVFVILTDGQENASKKFTRQQIFDMISHQKNNYKWEFLFIGAEQDAFTEASGIGIGYGHTIQYSNNAGGTHAIYASMSSNVTRARAASAQGDTSVTAAWTEEDRIAQDKAKADVMP